MKSWLQRNNCQYKHHQKGYKYFLKKSSCHIVNLQIVFIFVVINNLSIKLKSLHVNRNQKYSENGNPTTAIMGTRMQ